MKLTKYEHACFTLENNGDVLVVDPGNFTTDFIAPSDVVGIVVTHEHGDHLDKEHLAAIIAENPEATIIGHPEVLQHIDAFTTTPVLAGDRLVVGSFSLAFYGGSHAVIHSDMNPVANLGLMVNEVLYYPGDSFVRPDVPVDTLALPVGAPWLKISEVIDFVRDIQPRFVFPTHDAVLSSIGKGLADRLVPQMVPSVTYQRLDTPIEL